MNYGSPRSSTRPASRYGTTYDRPPLFPPVVSLFLRRRAQEVGGGALIGGAAVLLLALVSYHPADPSLNTATPAADVQNWLGTTGSYTSDFLIQSFGLAAFVPVVMLAGWGLRVILKQPLDNKFLRFSFTAIATLLAASALAGLPVFGAWPFGVQSGGAAGKLLLNMLTGWMPGAWKSFSAFWPPAVCAVMAGAMLFPALGFSYGQWGRGLRRAYKYAKWLAVVSYLLVMWVADRLQRKNDTRRPLLTEKFADLRAPSAADDEADDDYEADEPTYADEEAEAELPLGDAPAAKPRKAPKPTKRRRVETAYGRYEYPSLDFLALPDVKVVRQSADQIEQTAEELTSVLGDFGVQGQILKGSPGPVVTLYELEPAPGTKSARVIALAEDIARQMSALSVRVATVPGRNVLGIELPNKKRETVFLRELLNHPSYAKTNAKLPLALGKDIGGEPIVADLARMPHLLVAGTTGSGKSVSINTMILSLLYKHTPEQVRFIMVDPKMLELSIYDGIPHLLTPVVTEPKKAVVALKWTVREMEDRYRAMAKVGVRNIDGYNERIREAREKGETLTRRVQTGFDSETGKPVFEDQPIDLIDLPYIVVVVDEMADLMLVAGKDIEAAIQRLAQMARAAGIHIIMATQRPSVDVITGTIKANFPTRISFQVTSKIDSRTILGEMGAEQLLGQGDMLYMAGGGRITRVHGPFASDHEVEMVVRHLKTQGEPSYLEAVTKDEEGAGDMGAGGGGGDGGSGDALYDEAVQIVLRDKKASTSYLQRCLRIGYNSAARLIERMEREGLVSPANHVGKREILVPGESAR